MAKQYLKDLINMDYETLMNLAKKENIGSFKAILEHMVNSANRRIKTLLNSPIGEFSPAYKKLKDSGVDIFTKTITYKNAKTGETETVSLKNATSKQTGKMLEMYSNLKTFLKAKTSTLQGWQKTRSTLQKRLKTRDMFKREYKSKRSATIWINREKKFWRIYNKLVDEFGGIISQLDSERVQKMLYKVQTMKKAKKTDDYIQEVMESYISDLYEAKQSNKKFSDESFITKLEEEIRLTYVK